MNRRVRHVADDYQRLALIRAATERAAQLADEDFYHAQSIEGMPEADLDAFASHALTVFSGIEEFDYQQYARTLYLRAYKAAYRTHLRDLASGIRRGPGELADVVMSEIAASSKVE